MVLKMIRTQDWTAELDRNDFLFTFQLELYLENAIG